jgi:hypothetical protein
MVAKMIWSKDAMIESAVPTSKLFSWFHFTLRGGAAAR